MLKTIFLFLLTAGVAFPQGTSGTITGVVTDPLGAVVRDAKVSLMQGDTSAATATSDAEGRFSISPASPGRYRIQVEASGFATYRGPDLFVGSGGTAESDVVLSVGALRQEMVVSATGSEIPIAQVGASVTLIDSQDIQAQNKLDLLENLRQVGGAQVVQTSQRGGNTSLFIRGGESSFNKVLVDGVPVNNVGGGFDFAQLTTGGVQSVEVLKGANSVLFGADALAGVVNITTKRGTTALPELRLSADGGNFGTYNRDAAISGAWRRFDYFSQLARYDTQGSLPNAFFHNQTFAANVGFALNSKTDFRVTARRTWAGLGSPNGLYLYGIADDSASKNQNTYLSGLFQNQTTRRWHNLARFAYGQFVSQYINPRPTGTPFDSGFGFGGPDINFLGNPVTLRGANGTSVSGRGILDYGGFYPQSNLNYEARRSLYLQSDYSFFKEWTGTFGFRYEHENGTCSFCPPNLTRNNYSYFMEAHGNVGHRLYLTGGVGLENNAVFGFAASPRFSAAYYLRRPSSSAFVAETKLKFNFGRGIKEMSIYQQGNQLYAILTPAQRAQFNVAQLGPERSRGFDFGLEQGLWNGRARVEATYFNNRFYDLTTFLGRAALISIGVDPGAAAIASGIGGAYVNATSQKSQGLETLFVAELGSGLRFNAGYTYLDAEITKAFGSPAFGTNFPNIPIGQYSPLQGNRPFRRAPHTGSLGVLYSHRKLTASFTGYLVSSRDDSTFLSDGFYGASLLLPNQGLAPAYQKFDLSLRYNLKPWVSLYGSAENLFSQHYMPAYGFPATPMAFRAGMTFTIGGEAWRK